MKTKPGNPNWVKAPKRLSVTAAPEAIRIKYGKYLKQVLRDELSLEKFQTLISRGIDIAINFPEHREHFRYWKTFVDLGLGEHSHIVESNVQITVNDLRENAQFQQAILGIKPITVEVIESKSTTENTGLHQATIRGLPSEIPVEDSTGSVEVSDHREVASGGDNVGAGT